MKRREDVEAPKMVVLGFVDSVELSLPLNALRIRARALLWMAVSGALLRVWKQEQTL